MATDTGSIQTQRILLLGATGTIGQATLRALLRHGHSVVCLLRPGSSGLPEDPLRPPGWCTLAADVTDPSSLMRDAFAQHRFDAVVSCMASRTGLTRDAWAIDHQAHQHVLQACLVSGVRHFVLLSAICVQKPKLPFQHAKLAFEQSLMNSGIDYSIVRPTAFFKSLSGQIERLRRGQPFLLFGDGQLTACKPISDNDLAEYLATCLSLPERHNRVLTIGGPGPAITPIEQARMLCELMGRPLHVRKVPVALMRAIAATLQTLGLLMPRCRDAAELVRIGHYYATESMLVLNPETGSYDAALTPSWGQETLRSHYQKIIDQQIAVDLGDHSVF